MSNERASGEGRPSVWRVVRLAISDLGADDAMTHAGAVAFYSALSLAPLLLLMLWVAGMLGEGAQRSITDQLTGLIGEQGGQAIEQIIDNAQERPTARTAAGVIGILTLVFSATTVFGQFQHALNVIWDVKPKPGATTVGSVLGMVRKRLLSLGMIVTIGFLLLVSTVASAALSGITGAVGDALPGAEWVWQAANFLISIGVFTVFFAVLFRYLPDVRIPWKDVWLGAAVTAVLFAVGKLLIGMYLGMGSVGSAYGAAGSLIALLLWVYYAAVIVFVGAEITQAWATQAGHEIVPEEHAVRMDRSPNREPGDRSEAAERESPGRSERREPAPAVPGGRVRTAGARGLGSAVLLLSASAALDRVRAGRRVQG